MYTAHFGLNKHPFYPLSDPKVLYPSHELREAVCHFWYARLHHEGFFLLTGEVGTGKSTAIRAILRELPSDAPVAVLNHSTLSAKELLEAIVLNLNLPKSNRESKPKLLRRLKAMLTRYYDEGRQAVLILDEAHLMPDAALEEVRLLSNLRHCGHPLLQICLVGQPELIVRLRQPNFRPLRQRISTRYVLRPLSATDTEDYLIERLRISGAKNPRTVFHPSATKAVYDLSRGLPREINVLADQALMNAFIENASVVRAKHVRSVGKDYGFEGARLPLRARPFRLRRTASENPTVRIALKKLELGARGAALAKALTSALANAHARALAALHERSKLPRLARIWAAGALGVAAFVGMVLAGAALMIPDAVDERPASASSPEPSAPASPEPSIRPVASAVPAMQETAPEEPANPSPSPELDRSAEARPTSQTARRSEEPSSAASRPARAPAVKKTKPSLEDRYPSTLKVESEMPAEVWLGDERIGTAPGTFTPVPPGRHRIKLDGGDGRILQKDVIVTPGSTTYVRARSLSP